MEQGRQGNGPPEKSDAGPARAWTERAVPGKALDKWQARDAGQRYASERFGSCRAGLRDVRLVESILDRWAPGGRARRLLDAPCGSGRLAPALRARAEHYTGLDASRSMLETAASGLAQGESRASGLAEADLLRLPFRSGSFDVVVACRFLHHLREEEDLARAVDELLRVSRGLVIASFWDACSLPAWRRRAGLRRDEGPRGRSAVERARLERILRERGAEVLAWRASFRFLSQQTFFAARVGRAPA